MSLKPLPSRTIALYTARLFLMRVLAFLAGLVIILQTLDLLSESSKILAAPGNGDAELWRYVTLRIPQLIAQFLPFSVLLATLLTLATLNQNSEIVIFKAAGISAHQILMPLIIAAFGIAIAHFAFNELVLTRTNAQLAAWEEVEYGALPRTTDVNTEVWVRDGSNLLHVEAVEGRGRNVTLHDLIVYERTKDQRLTGVIQAPIVRPVDGGWMLEQARRFDVASGVQQISPRLFLKTDVTPDRFTATSVVPERTPFWELRDAIRELRAAGRPVDTLVAALHHKISGPLAAILMPILGAVAAFGLARSGKLFVRTVIGMALGFAFFVADNFMIAMGEFGAAPPWLAAWAPFLLFLLIGESVLFRTEE